MRYYPHILALLIFILFIITGINPASTEVWIVEIFPVFIVFFALVFSYFKFKFSNTAYSLMSVWIILHTIGAHYTFANVPFEYITNLFDFQRNHFDRIAHFSIGFYAYAMAEFLVKKEYSKDIVASFFGLFFIMSVACGYEIIEWWFAVIVGGDVGVEFLGSQGDVWDAQKDMLADTIGAVVALCLFQIQIYLKKVKK
ncbi:MAG: DUF2238 domain-containing protein [Campylobacterota bacterium]|nr:DUF2238 domain-containing protein [Campylobacterota bacterium]